MVTWSCLLAGFLPADHDLSCSVLALLDEVVAAHLKGDSPLFLLFAEGLSCCFSAGWHRDNWHSLRRRLNTMVCPSMVVLLIAVATVSMDVVFIGAATPWLKKTQFFLQVLWEVSSLAGPVP